MSRLIDADALMKAMYHMAFETDGDTMWHSGCWVRYRAIEQVVKEQPDIIRCKNCKYSAPNGVYGCRLERFSALDESARLFAYDYCSAAERR